MVLRSLVLLSYIVTHTHTFTPAHFPLVERLANLKPVELDALAPVPDIDNGTILQDAACPMFMTSGTLLVCGNIFVRGRLQILTSVNVTVFEQASFKADDVTIKTHTVGKFVAHRCSKIFPDAAESIQCSVKGNLVVPQGGLIVSGSLTVLGSAMAGSIHMDGASSAAFGVAAFLGMKQSSESSVSGAIGRRSGRKNSPTQAPQRAAYRKLSLTPKKGALDSLCRERENIMDAIFIPQGLMYLKNAARLFTFGKSVINVVGLDRASQWLSRCGGVTAVPPDDSAGGHIGLLSASELRVTGPDGVTAGNLLVADGSSLTCEGKLDIQEVAKVFQSSVLEVLSQASLYDAVLSRGSAVAVTQLQVADLLMMTQATLIVTQALAVKALEAYDGSVIDTNAGIRVADYMVLDDGSAVNVRQGPGYIGGSLLAANFSSLVAPTSNIIVREELKARSGAVIKCPQLRVGCSVLLDAHSDLTVKSQLSIRDDAHLPPDNTTCAPSAPILFVRESQLNVGHTLSFGSVSLNDTGGTINGTKLPTASIIDRSQVQINGNYVSISKDHALVLKNQAKFTVKDGRTLHPGKLLVLEGLAHLSVTGVKDFHTSGVDMSESSVLELGEGSGLRADWVKLISQSVIHTHPGSFLGVNRYMELELKSKGHLEGVVDFSSPSFDHLLCTTESSLRITDQVGGSPVYLSQDVIAQDSATVDIHLESGPLLFRNATLISETFSRVTVVASNMKATTDASIILKHTPESEITLECPQIPPYQEQVYLLKVPPSDSATLAQFLIDHQKPKLKKNTFWDSWVQTSSDNTTTSPVEKPLPPPSPPSQPTRPVENEGAKRRSGRRAAKQATS